MPPLFAEIVMTIPPLTAAHAAAPPPDRLQMAARKLETAFIAEMLRSSGFGKQPDPMGGGGGQDHFTSFLIDAQAERIAAAGGIGLAESLFRAMAGGRDA